MLITSYIKVAWDFPWDSPLTLADENNVSVHKIIVVVV